MPAAARQGDLIGHAPPIPPVTAGAVAGAALGIAGAASLGSGAPLSTAVSGARAAAGSAVGGGGGGGVSGVVTGMIVPFCSGNVFTNGIPAARAILDKAVCSLHPPVPLPIVSGSSNVFINGAPAARLGDKIFCGAVILTASGNVFIGGSAGGETVETNVAMPDDSIAPLMRDGLLMADAGSILSRPTDNCYTQAHSAMLAEFSLRNAGQLVPIGRFDSFLLFNSVGRFLTGMYAGVKDVAFLQRNIVERESNHIIDAYGYGKQALLGVERGVVGDERPYQPNSALFRSIETNGVGVTIGGEVHKLVIGASGLATMQALMSRNPELIGRESSSVLLGGAGSVMASRMTALTTLRIQKIDAIPATGVASFDALATSSSSFERKMEALERAGYKVNANPSLIARGEFSPGKVFDYNPETMTRLDLTHEMRHFKQLQQMELSGIKLNSSSFRTAKGPAELGAYNFEEKLWTRTSMPPNRDYLDFHKKQLELQEDAMATYRREAAGKYGAKWRDIKW